MEVLAFLLATHALKGYELQAHPNDGAPCWHSLWAGLNITSLLVAAVTAYLVQAAEHSYNKRSMLKVAM